MSKDEDSVFMVEDAEIYLLLVPLFFALSAGFVLEVSGFILEYGRVVF